MNRSVVAVSCLVSLACAGAEPPVAAPNPPSRPRCGPGAPAGTRCGPPAPALVPLADGSIHTIITTERGAVRLRAIVVTTATGASLVVERWESDRLVAQRPVTLDDSGPAVDAIRDPRWSDPDTLSFVIGRERDAYNCQLERAGAGADRAACVIARGGSRPR